MSVILTLYFSSALALGTLTTTADLSTMPSLDEMEPDGAYLAWTFELETDADRADVEETFEFVVDDCELSIVDLADARDEAVDAESSLRVERACVLSHPATGKRSTVSRPSGDVRA